MPNTGDIRNDPRFVRVRAMFDEVFQVLTFKFQLDGLDENAAIDQVVGRFEKLIESANGPIFDNEGYIPPIQCCTEAEAVRWFATNIHRERLVERVRHWIDLARAVTARRLLLDGSFVTEKNDPEDVDAVILLPEDFWDQLMAGHSPAHDLQTMIETREPPELFAAEDEEDWWQWFEFFSRTREATGRCKGLIEISLG